MRKRYSLSLFTYEPGMLLKDTTLKKKPHAPEISGSKAVGEGIILAIIAQYGFITLPLIQRCLNLKGHSRIDASKALPKMQLKGRILKYTAASLNKDKQDVDIYCLTKEERKRLKNEGKKLIPYRYDMENVSYIFEHLSLIQWHIACMEQGHIKEAAYNWKVALKDGRLATIPSLVAFKTILDRKMYMLAFCAPKGKHKEDLARFFVNVFLVNEYIRENSLRFRRYAYVLICEDDKQAEDICRYLMSIKETAGMFFLYTSDSMTSNPMVDPLTLLYELHVDETGINRRVISIK